MGQVLHQSERALGQTWQLSTLTSAGSPYIADGYALDGSDSVPVEPITAEGVMSRHDEDSDDRLLDQMGKAVKNVVCRAKFQDRYGIWRVCTKPKGHRGKHKQ